MTLSQQDRDDIVELLRCTADQTAAHGRVRFLDQIAAEIGTSPMNEQRARDCLVAVERAAAPLVTYTWDASVQQCLEAAQLLEAGEWP